MQSNLNDVTYLSLSVADNTPINAFPWTLHGTHMRWKQSILLIVHIVRNKKSRITIQIIWIKKAPDDVCYRNLRMAR